MAPASSLPPHGAPVATNLLDLVAAAASEHGDRPYLLPVEPESRVITFADVLTFANGCAALFDSRGVPRGARVAVIMHNSSLATLLFLGVVAAQRVLVPLNPKSGEAELDGLLGHAQPALTFGRAAAAAKLRPRSPWVEVEDGEALVADILARGSACRGHLTSQERSGAQDAEIVYTSYSATGSPKGVVLSHRSLISPSLALARWAEADADDVFLNVSPWFGAGGQVFPMLTPLWCGGQSVCVRSEAAMARFWTYVNRYRPTWTLVVPAYLAYLAERPERPEASRLKGALSGGSPLGPELTNRFEEMFDLPVYQVYGMTEMAAITTVEPRHRKSGDRRTAGLPLEGCRVRVVGPDGRDVARGETGEVLLTGANMFSRYHDAPDLTARRLDNGWIRSGDLGQLDENGELSIVGRLDSMVIVSGSNVYPVEVERAASHLDGIADAVLTTMPHPVTGVELILVYTLLPGAAAAVDGWRAALLKHVSTFKVPRRFVALGELGIDAFPRTAHGEVVRTEVQRLVTEHLETKR
jgi:acyl-CoA synthetase (AMP-forming)/AMP-acid ligase II